MDDWGERLSSRIRVALGERRFDVAARLAAKGDGQTRSLEKEYAMMYKGLGATVGVLLRLLEAMATEEPAASPVTALLRRFRREFACLLERAYGARPAAAAIPDLDALVHGSVASASAEFVATAALLGHAERLFDDEQGRLAREVIDAIAGEDAAHARALIDDKEQQQYVPLHDRLVRFMAEVFGCVLEHFGPDGLYAFHRATADGQRRGFEKWEQMDAAGLTRATASLGKQHMARLRVSEDREKFTILQTPCGSGGRLRLAGAYDGPTGLPFVQGPGALTLGQQRLPVYCSHCPIWNSVAPIEWFGHPQLVFEDAARADGSCTLHVFKHPTDIPAAYYDSLGMARARR